MNEPVARLSGSGLLTAAEVRAYLNVSRSTLRAIPASKLPFVKINTRGDRRYALEDVERYLTDRRES